jgi:hypothetical protein
MERTCQGKDPHGDSAELHYTENFSDELGNGKKVGENRNIRKSTLSRWPHRKENTDDYFARRKFVDRKTLEVTDHDDHGEGHAGAPEDIADDDGPKGVLRIRQDVRNDGSGS